LGPRQAPTLAEVLERAAGRIRLDVELKEDGYVEAAAGRPPRPPRPAGPGGAAGLGRRTRPSGLRVDGQPPSHPARHARRPARGRGITDRPGDALAHVASVRALHREGLEAA